MLTQSAGEGQDGRNGDEPEGRLRDGARREGFYFLFAALLVRLFVPAREGGQEDDGDEGEGDGSESDKINVSRILAPWAGRRTLSLRR